MSYRLLIFDFDGTLADSFGWFVGNINRIAVAHGCRPLDLGRLDEYRGLGARALMAQLGMPLWKVPAVTAAMRRSMDASIDAIRPFPGALELLQALRTAGVQTAVVSSNSRDNVARVLGAGAALVDHYGCGVSIFGKRPVLRRMLQASRVAAGAALAVGDETRDGEAAAAAGIDFVGVAWGYATPAALRPLSRRPPFTRFEEILDAATGAPPPTPTVRRGA